MNNQEWFKTIKVVEDHKKKDQINLLELRQGLTIKLLVLSTTLFVIFWFFFLGKLSIYFALVCALVFGGISVYYLMILGNIYKALRGLK